MDSDVDDFERGTKELVEALETRIDLREGLRQLWRSTAATNDPVGFRNGQEYLSDRHSRHLT